MNERQSSLPERPPPALISLHSQVHDNGVRGLRVGPSYNYRLIRYVIGRALLGAPWVTVDDVATGQARDELLSWHSICSNDGMSPSLGAGHARGDWTSSGHLSRGGTARQLWRRRRW